MIPHENEQTITQRLAEIRERHRTSENEECDMAFLFSQLDQAEARYISAVNGRRDFRAALVEARKQLEAAHQEIARLKK